MTTDSIKVVSTTEFLKERAEAAKAAAPAKEEPAADDPVAPAAKTGAQAETVDESGASEQEQEEGTETNPTTEGEEEEGDGEESEGEEQPKKKSRGGFQKRIDKLTKAKATAEQENARLRAELETARVGRQPPKVETKKDEPAPANAKTDDEPKVDDFESYAEYTKAIVKWQNVQERKAAEAETAQTTERKRREGVVEKFKETSKAAQEKHKDYVEVLTAAKDITPPQHVAVALFESDDGGELEYQLSKRPEEYKRICSLAPAQALRELGRFEAKHLSASETKTESKKITAAPPPINPVGGKGSGAAKKSIYDPSLSQKDFEALEEARLRAKRA